MIRTLLLATAALGLVAGPLAHAAPPCKGKTGKIIKCAGARGTAARPAPLIAGKKAKARVTDTSGHVSYKW